MRKKASSSNSKNEAKMTQGTKVACNGRADEALWTLNVRRAGDGNDESGPYSPTSTPVKKIRVVSTFEFELK